MPRQILSSLTRRPVVEVIPSVDPGDGEISLRNLYRLGSEAAIGTKNTIGCVLCVCMCVYGEDKTRRWMQFLDIDPTYNEGLYF